MKLYYNEIDTFAIRWLGNLSAADLIPAGIIDARSIADVQPDDVREYGQCHFFAGIGGWPLALQIAGWPANRPVWTGSCPCQPFSCAGKGGGENDSRHLWPEFRRLIAECHPPTVFGEQVASADGRRWLSRVRTDLEGMGYGVGAADLCAAGSAAPHIRQRLFWVAVATGSRCYDEGKHGSGLSSLSTRPEQRRVVGSVADSQCSKSELRDGQVGAGEQRWDRPTINGSTSTVAHPHGLEFCGEPPAGQQSEHEQDDGGSNALAYTKRDGGRIDQPEQGAEGRTADRRDCAGTCGLGDAYGSKLAGRQSERRDDGEEQPATARAGSVWSDFRIVVCRDIDKRTGTNALRRVSIEPGAFPLAARLPRGMGQGSTRAERMGLVAAKANRVGRLRGYGNSIVPQVAAEFVRAFLETER